MVIPWMTFILKFKILGGNNARVTTVVNSNSNIAIAIAIAI